MFPIYNIIAFLTHPVRFVRDRSKWVFTRIHGLEGNSIESPDTVIKKSHIRFLGKGSTIQLTGCDLFEANIFLRGSGHKLIIEEGVKLYNVRIKIIGRGNTIHIGRGTTFGSGNIICGGNGTRIRIGEACMLAEGIDIWNTDTHSIFKDGILVNPPADIVIGNHVWTGKDVAILKGVTIGDDAVIGMKSLVTKDILPSTLNAGIPASLLKEGITWSGNNPNNL